MGRELRTETRVVGLYYTITSCENYFSKTWPNQHPQTRLQWSDAELGRVRKLEADNPTASISTLAKQLKYSMKQQMKIDRSEYSISNKLRELRKVRTEARERVLSSRAEISDTTSETPARQSWRWSAEESEIAKEIEEANAETGAKTLNKKLRRALKDRLGVDRGLGGCRRKIEHLRLERTGIKHTYQFVDDDKIFIIRTVGGPANTRAEPTVEPDSLLYSHQDSDVSEVSEPIRKRQRLPASATAETATIDIWEDKQPVSPGKSHVSRFREIRQPLAPQTPNVSRFSPLAPTPPFDLVRTPLCLRLDGFGPALAPVRLSDCTDMNALMEQIQQSWGWRFGDSRFSHAVARFPWLLSESDILLQPEVEGNLGAMIKEVGNAPVWKKGPGASCDVDVVVYLR